MFNSKTLLALAAAGFIFAPAITKAADSVSTSYAAKKQGHVPFVKQDAAAPSASEQDPSTIEPAAGAEDSSAEMSQDRSALEDNIRLPRKN